MIIVSSWQKLSIAALFIYLLLVSCSFETKKNQNNQNILDLTSEEICQIDSSVCEDLNQGEIWCEKERSNQITNHFLYKKTSDKQITNQENKSQTKQKTQQENLLYDLLISLQEYTKCMNLAKNVEYINDIQRNYQQEQIYIKNIKKTSEFEQKILDSKNPYLLLYKYQYLADSSALENILNLKDEAAPIEVQEFLALYFAKTDKKQSIDRYLDILDQDKKRISSLEKISLNLSKLYFDLDKKGAAYVWLKVSYEQGSENVIWPPKTGFNLTQKRQEKLLLKSKALIELLEVRQFSKQAYLSHFKRKKEI